MRINFKDLTFQMFGFFFIISTIITGISANTAIAMETNSDIFIKKVSKGYTKKFCNAIAFGLSKESAMSFSLEENKKVFIKRKEMKNINKELLAEEIAISVVEECGYPINLSGEKDIQEFKNYYLTKDSEST